MCVSALEAADENPEVEEDHEGWPRRGPLVLRGDRETAAAAKARAREHLAAGEFGPAVAALEAARVRSFH